MDDPCVVHFIMPAVLASTVASVLLLESLPYTCRKPFARITELDAFLVVVEDEEEDDDDNTEDDDEIGCIYGSRLSPGNTNRS